MRSGRGRSLYWRLLTIEIAVLGLFSLGFATLASLARGPEDAPWAGDLTLLAEAVARTAELARSPDEASQLTTHAVDLVAKSPDHPWRTSDFSYAVRRPDNSILVAMGALPTGTATSGHIEYIGEWILYTVSSPQHTLRATVGVHRAAAEGREPGWPERLLTPAAMLALLLSACLWPAVVIGARPLVQLAGELTRRAPDDTRPIKLDVDYVELSPLVAALNGLFTRVHHLRESKRGFFAEAAHELRTPLAAIGAQAHLVAHEPDSSARCDAAVALSQGIDRAGRVVQRLAMLVELDAVSTLAQSRPVHLGMIAARVAALYESRAGALGQKLVVAADAAVIVLGDGDLIEAAVEALVDNATRYTTPGTTIEIFVSRTEGLAIFGVEDDGPGIPAANRERVFQRFERLGATDNEGSGLGLAIVRSIAELHRGRAELLPRPGRGCRFEIRVPLLNG
jgi:two-component system sensor histidine kinase QseC